MTDSVQDLTPQQREKRNQELKVKAEARLKHRGAPFFGATENDILDLKIQIPQLIQSLNQAIKDIHKISQESQGLSDALQEQKLINQTLRNLLVAKQVISAEEVADNIESHQLIKMGLRPKLGEDVTVESDDHVLFKFKIFHEGKLIDDKTTGVMAYHVGSNGIPCDPEIIGMREKETKTCSVICQFQNETFKEYYGKEIDMEIYVAKILQKVS